MVNWNREYRMKATSNGGSFEIGEKNEHGLAVHINFTVERAQSTVLNTTKIKVWNLTRTQINILMVIGCSIQLMAGYGDSRPIIFTGTVSNVCESLDGADRLIEIEAVDGFAETSETVISVSYKDKKNGVSTYAVFLDIANALALPVEYSPSAEEILQNTSLGKKYSFSGYAQDSLDEICEAAGLNWDIQNGILEIRKSDESMRTVMHLLDRSTGLLGVPYRIYESAVSSCETDTLTDTLFGYRVDYFLNGAICVADRVYLKADIVQGLFMVAKLTINGDNMEGKWQCQAELVAVTG